MMRPAAMIGMLIALAGCMAEPGVDDQIGAETRASLGGTPDTDFPNVCVMHVQPPLDDEGNPQDEFACTCTLIEAQTVLTSAHCVSENLEKEEVEGIVIKFGTGFGGGDPAVIDGGAAGITLHRYFDPDLSGVNELALIRLAEAPSSEPVQLIAESLDGKAGQDLTLVGFGVTIGDDVDIDGVRNQITTPITSVEERHILAGTSERTTCAGDSGGPGFLDGATDPVLAVMTARQDECTAAVQRIRLDLYLDSFLLPFIDNYSGACPLDGECTTTGCRTPDRDCPENKCLWQAQGNPDDCEEDCPTRDWDCELGSLVGQACSKDGDCEEGGRCVVAADDASFMYCNRPCGAELADCPGGMECEGGECAFLTPSPGSPGAACSGPDACRSGVCECGECQVEAGAGACTQGGGGFCAVGGGGEDGGGPAGALALIALLALGFPVVVRRRRRLY